MSNFYQYIENFVSFIRKYEQAMKANFSLLNTPYIDIGKLFPKTGSIEIDEKNIEFHYHGAGVTVNYGSIILDYNFHINDRFYIKISPWKFTQFIKSIDNESDINVEIVQTQMFILAEKGLLNRMPHGLAYFEINLDKLKESGVPPRE
jgi:hypothetical protein